jgi:hypothetical protein
MVAPTRAQERERAVVAEEVAAAEAQAVEPARLAGRRAELATPVVERSAPLFSSHELARAEAVAALSTSLSWFPLAV